MDHYSRKQKKSETHLLPKKQDIAQGFTTLQKTIALIGSILSLITASITIHNALNKDKEKSDSEPKIEQQTVIREIEKEVSTPTLETQEQGTTLPSESSVSETEASSLPSSSETAVVSTPEITTPSIETSPSTNE
ncbi:DUF6556 family protein [Streptococcus himalayensis]|uniref:TBC1 domain family member 8B n=1 Tax=Streptococcus himalayensis TaxID=1888195 RepID=A0A917EEC7_9STRE|nr:DUF6556 family protein [Streptococcus himalayensis]GGE28187.1 hypothetical protein GCM10011510_06720 [Streptococcus himalayensis]